MSVRTEQDRVRERARRMVELLERDELTELAGLTGKVIDDDGTERSLLYPLLIEIIDACAQMITARAGAVSPETTFVIDLAAGDTEDVDIDELPPALRAFLRAILALLEGHWDDAYFQLSMAADDPHARGRLDALVHGLLFLDALLSEGPNRSTAPAWLV